MGADQRPAAEKQTNKQRPGLVFVRENPCKYLPCKPFSRGQGGEMYPCLPENGSEWRIQTHTEPPSSPRGASIRVGGYLFSRARRPPQRGARPSQRVQRKPGRAWPGRRHGSGARGILAITRRGAGNNGCGLRGHIETHDFLQIWGRCIYTYKGGRMFMQSLTRTHPPPYLQNKNVGVSTPAGACRFQRGTLKKRGGATPSITPKYN